jgi:hypothetical protein
MDPSDSRRGPTVVMSSHRRSAAQPPPRRVSQVPRLIWPRALSPITPGGPMGAFARFFPIGGGLHHCLAGWPLSISVTRPNRVHLRYGSRVRSARLQLSRLLRRSPASLPAERAINRATTVSGCKISQTYPGAPNPHGHMQTRFPFLGNWVKNSVPAAGGSVTSGPGYPFDISKETIR